VGVFVGVGDDPGGVVGVIVGVFEGAGVPPGIVGVGVLVGLGVFDGA